MNQLWMTLLKRFRSLSWRPLISWAGQPAGLLACLISGLQRRLNPPNRHFMEVQAVQVAGLQGWHKKVLKGDLRQKQSGGGGDVGFAVVVHEAFQKKGG